MTIKTINIKPKCKRNRRFLLCLGCLLLVCSSLLNMLLWDEYKIQLIFIMAACLMVFFVGFIKFLEPSVSYSITPEAIFYYHRYGQWLLPWADILRIGEITVEVCGERQQLPYLGIKLNDLQHLAQSISPRLANKLLHEQQELLLLAVKNGEIILDNGVINFEPFQLHGVTYKGPIAAWLYRSEQLASAYGYHLYLPENSFDRDLNDFLRLLKECQDYINVHT